jgi:hypothetical protein
MPPSPSEPEKYSIDEMMDRLKNVPSENPEDGELVIRSDGSQAIRVKKRKRRSSQPLQLEKIATRRVRIVQVSAALILVFLALLAAGGAIIYANSSPFREGLLRKIQETSGASVEIEQFRMNPQTANAANLALNWPSGNILRRLNLRGLKAEVFPSSFFGKLMTGEEVSAGDGRLELQYPQAGEALRSFPKPEGPPAILFNRYRISSLQITLGNPPSPLMTLSKSEASLNTETVNGNSQLSLYNGDIAIPNWPKLRLDRALLEFRGTETDIVGLRLLHEADSKGEFELSGTIYPTLPDRISSLDVMLDSFNISGITGPLLGRLFAGRIDTQSLAKSNFLAFQPTEESSPVMEISFTVSPSSKMELRGFPFLNGLAQAMDDPWFQEPFFESDATGAIERTKGSVILRKLNFESKARMACRGEVKMASNQQLTGNLEIGVAEAMIGASKNLRLKSLFGPTKDGFRWLVLKIGGTAASPTDNFRELFAAVGTIPRDASSTADDPGATFEELTRPK